ncbi:chemotaxis response regulator protein-glutamate methylesterase [Virgibacillus halodenitrificans]|uniref:protein-glutamate methylesterase/protein-glutamine glutaminase n=1 Tax=Virgibacillus halodenitrificans TaxID=1482 RepID=UPI001F1CF222|nr:chemotaxis response regulator protein-glutamate methylesterase [Virgibacillus halodenitrificans]MCG1028720.1 chemotaxis response regulator protein-glutamate methylesterase [Virgibacillus halodenitrificans]
MSVIRVLIVDDSAFMRKVITDILESDDRISVIGTARNGEDGMKKINQLQPDVVTLDVQMPVMDGMTALQEIMKKSPLPVIMLSSLTSEGTSKTIEAISNGAVDFITKPSGSISMDMDKVQAELIKKVVTAAEIKLPKVGQLIKQPKITPWSQHQRDLKTIVAIGTSTGGPRALQHVLTKLPGNLPASILIVQHMPAGFTKSLAERLNSLCAIHVKEASDGESLRESTVYIAPGNYHMKVNGTRIQLTQDEPVHGHRPAVDTLFNSLAKNRHYNKFAVILTGMGSDGSNGIRNLKREDPNTIVLSEAEDSAVVYGMPFAAVKTKLVDHVIPLQEMGPTISTFVLGNK